MARTATEMTDSLLLVDIVTEASPVLGSEPAALRETAPILLATKHFPPRLRSELLWRQRLIDRLDASVERPLTIVCAPPGFGKTTLAAQWVTRAGRPVAWLSLAPGDDDPATFLSYLIAALHAADPALVASTRAYLDAPGASSTHAAACILVNELATRGDRVAVVLDDYHAVSHPAIHATVGFLVDNLPGVLGLVVLTRAEPPLPLARLRARGGLTELRSADLRFTREEAGAYFSLLDASRLTLGDIDALTERAEGWVTGLHLAAVSIQGRSREEIASFVDEFSGSVRLVDDYLIEETLCAQPADLRSFLVRTSILERFTAELCEVVTGRAGGRDALGRLERANLFLVPLDEDRRWFRYHHLFADFLRGQLHQQVSEPEILAGHRRAAAWFETHGLVEEAANHALAGRDWDLGLRLVEDIAARLVAEDRLVTLRQWLESLPPEALQARPRLSYWLAWSLTWMGGIAAARRPLEAAEQAWTVAKDHTALAAASTLHGLRCLMQGDPHGAIGHSARALDGLPPERRFDRAFATVLLGDGLGSLGDLPAAERTLAAARAMFGPGMAAWLSPAEASASGWILLRQGKLREAESVFQEVIRVGDARYPDPAIRARRGLAELARERNALDEAERQLTKADELARQSRSSQHAPALDLAVARVAWARGDAESAFGRLRLAVEKANAIGDAGLARRANAFEARFWLDRGEVTLARRRLDESGLDPFLPPSYPRQDELLTFVRLFLAQGQGDAALLLLDRLQRAAEEMGRLGEVVEMQVLRAVVLSERDAPEAAAPAIERALGWGEPEGYVRVFVEHGARVAPLLRYAAARGVHRDYGRRLLAALADGSVTATPVSPAAGSLLSDRELEVLRLVAVGHSNRAVGAKLYISEGTVKKHLGSIIGKLMVVNRTQAVDQARKLGLL